MNPFVKSGDIFRTQYEVTGSFTYSANNLWRYTGTSFVLQPGQYLLQVSVSAINTNATNWFAAVVATSNADSFAGAIVQSGSLLRPATTTIGNVNNFFGKVCPYSVSKPTTLYLKVYAEDSNSEQVTCIVSVTPVL